MTSAWGGRQVRRIDQRPRQKSAAGSGPAPSSAFIVARRVIIFGPNGGLFVYSPTPGFGSLIYSITPSAGFDNFGNATLQGATDYGTIAGTLFAVNVNGGEIAYLTAATEAGPWTNVATLAAISPLIGDGTGMSMSGRQYYIANVVLISPSGDTSGVKDRSAIASALGGPNLVMLAAGTFYLNALITVAGSTLCGADMSTIVQPNTTGAPYTGALLAAGNKGTIRNLTIANSGSDAITIAGGISEVWLQDLLFSTNAGSCINWTPTGTVHGRIRGIRGLGGGTANGGGIRIDGGVGASRTAEINIYDVDIQNCTTSEVLFLSAVTDVLVSQVNGGIESVASGGTAPAAVTIQGSCQTCQLFGLDVGGNNNSPALQVLAAGGNSPSDLWVEGKLQQGSQGLVVGGATTRSRFYVNCTRNQGDGAQLNDTGTSNKIMFMGNLNNQAAGVAYDINVTSSGHWFIDAPQYGTPGGGAVTANLNITIAGNHVTHATPPAGSTSAGAAQAGW